MQIIGEKVINKNNETGEITKQTEDRITVAFPDRTATFIYPDAFLTFLKALNPEIQNVLKEEAQQYAADKKRKKDEAASLDVTQLEKRRTAWLEKQERDRRQLEEIEKLRRAAREEEEKRRKATLLSQYVSDDLTITDKVLFKQAEAILKSIYGEKASFRSGQYEAIERTIKEKRLLVVQKTGWGKSLVYFICTKLLRNAGAGVTLVISPLLALMDNQLSAAEAMGLNCAALNSTTSSDRESILEGMVNNKYDLVLATPESLFNKTVHQYLPSIKIGLLVIDEAHCISDWGHDFRLEYSKIYKVIEQLQPNVPVLATTATANNAVIDDLISQMGVPSISRGHLMRDNLSIQVLNLPDKESRYAWILDNISRLPGTGIIYCLSKKDCTWLSGFLNENNISARAYFSGDSDQEQRSQEALQAFIDDRIKVIVSTIKLGMGFDKGNVSFIIHFQCPKNVIAYYQQIGRAGRNIDFARTFLMLGNEDYKINKGFIDNAFPSEQDMKRIRNYITGFRGTCTINKICEDIDISKKKLQKILDFLEDGGFVVKEWRSSSGGKRYAAYRSTPVPFVYRREHYEGIKAIRYKELEQMQQIAKTSDCLSRTIVSCLDDIEDHDCGVCSNCDTRSRFPEKVSEVNRRKAHSYLEDIIITIDPWYYWPRNSIIPEGKNRYPNLNGIALSVYNEGIIGRLVSEGKYQTHRFDDRLVKKAAKALKKHIEQSELLCITAVPSMNSNVVPDFAERLADACGLPYIPMLRKTNNSHQKDLNNTSHQFENAYRSFEILPDAEVPSGVVLVDDMVDSGLTLAVCGSILRENGCDRVFPLALADSSSGGKDDEDDE